MKYNVTTSANYELLKEVFSNYMLTYNLNFDETNKIDHFTATISKMIMTRKCGSEKADLITSVSNPYAVEYQQEIDEQDLWFIEACIERDKFVANIDLETPDGILDFCARFNSMISEYREFDYVIDQ